MDWVRLMPKRLPMQGTDFQRTWHEFQLRSHSAFVTIGDVNTEACLKAAEELGKYEQLDPDFLAVVWLTAILPQSHRNVQALQCDVTSWEDQASLFEEAIKFSPSGTIDIVIANAGLGALCDPLVQPGDLSGPATKPDLRILEVNLRGILYTTRLALHYLARFQTQGVSDRSLILMGSMSAYVDWERSLQYPVSKGAVRTLMKCLRRMTWKDGIRVNSVAPA